MVLISNRTVRTRFKVQYRSDPLATDLPTVDDDDDDGSMISSLPPPTLAFRDRIISLNPLTSLNRPAILPVDRHAPVIASNGLRYIFRPLIQCEDSWPTERLRTPRKLDDFASYPHIDAKSQARRDVISRDIARYDNPPEPLSNGRHKPIDAV